MVSAMSMAHDEKSFFSAGWDGVALVSFLTRFFREFVHLRTCLELGPEHRTSSPELCRARFSIDSNRRSTPQPAVRSIGR